MTKPKKITPTKGSANNSKTKPTAKSESKKVAPKKTYSDEEEEDDEDLDLEMDEMDVSYDKDLGFDDDDDDDDY